MLKNSHAYANNLDFVSRLSILSKCGGYLFSVNPYIAEYE